MSESKAKRLKKIKENIKPSKSEKIASIGRKKVWRRDKNNFQINIKEKSEQEEN